MIAGATRPDGRSEEKVGTAYRTSQRVAKQPRDTGIRREVRVGPLAYLGTCFLG
jgi:hypothetical protein